jgi:hypothetical protein
MDEIGAVIPVIVATQNTDFKDPPHLHIGSIGELSELLSEAFPNLFRGVVLVDLGSTLWHQEFIMSLRKIGNA